MSEPLVSIVIPTWTDFDAKREGPNKRLSRSIRSVLNNNYRPVEIVVADDGTPEYYGRDIVAETIDMLRDEIESEEDFTIVHLKLEHEGQAHALNQGFNAARGKYIMDLNDDDMLTHDFLEEAVKLMEEQANKEIGYLYSDYLYTRNWSTFKPVTPPPEPWNVERLKEMQIAPVIGLIRDWVAKKVKFDTTLDHEEDWDYLLRISQVTDAKFVPKLYSFIVFVHSEQKSVTDTYGVARCQNIIRERIKAGYYDRTEGKR